MQNGKSVSNLFAGTREKCVGCQKTVYPIEKVVNLKFHKEKQLLLIKLKHLANLDYALLSSKVSVNGTPYHRSCFKCTHGGCTISPSNYIAHEGKLYCKHHNIQLFKEKGNYSQLENEREKHSMTEQVTAMEIAAES